MSSSKDKRTSKEQEIDYSSFSSFIGNKYAYQELLTWFHTYSPEHTHANYLNRDSCVIVSGPYGVGKTTMVKNICSFLKKHILWINADNCINSKVMEDMIIKYTQSTIDSIWIQENEDNKDTKDIYDNDAISKKDVIIVIDDLDILISQDRTIVSSFLQIIDKNILPNKPLICICDNVHEKKLNASKTPFYTIRLKPISDVDICLYIRNKYTSLSYTTCVHISEVCDGNIVQALELAKFENQIETSSNDKTNSLSYDLSNTAINTQPIEKIPLLANMYDEKDIHGWYRFFYHEPWMYPLRFHENLINEMDNSKTLKSTKSNFYNYFLRGLIEWDTYMMHNIIQEDEDTFHQNIPTTLFAHYADYIRRNIPRHYPLKRSVDTLTEFTKILSQLSLQKKNYQALYQQYEGEKYPIQEVPFSWFTDS